MLSYYFQTSQPITLDYVKQILYDEIKLHEALIKSCNENNEIYIKSKTPLGKIIIIALELCSVIDFYEQLDKKYNIIAFTNGVYDMNNRIFRKCLPKDMVSITLSYDYIENISTEKAEEYINNLIPNISIQNYILKLLACYLNPNLENDNNMDNILNKRIHLSFLNIHTIIGNIFEKYARIIDSRYLLTNTIENINKTKLRLVYITNQTKDLTIRDLYQLKNIKQHIIKETNEFPNFDKFDEYNIFRVFILVPNCIRSTNPLHENKFNKMLKQQIMYLLLNKYCPMYLTEGLYNPLEILNLTSKWKNVYQNEIFVTFINENYNGNYHNDNRILYEKYKKCCLDKLEKPTIFKEFVQLVKTYEELQTLHTL